MASAKKIPTIESKALSIAIKRAMVTRDMKVPALAKESGVPYGTLRKLLELNSVADYEQLRRIAEALRMPLSEIVQDAENLAEDPDVIADYRHENGLDTPAASASAVEDANTALADADNGIDIYDLAERIKAEDSVREEQE
ncbi:MAG: helix-turn-helix transcriptional regulator [Bifidobacterium choerinum]